jgi:hypothetical protein
MKILLLNLYYPPDTSATAKMAHTVVDTICIHHRVTVLCGRPSYDPTEQRPWRPYQTENVDLVQIIRAVQHEKKATELSELRDAGRSARPIFEL